MFTQKHDKVLELLNRLISQVVSQPNTPQSARDRLRAMALSIAKRWGVVCTSVTDLWNIWQVLDSFEKYLSFIYLFIYLSIYLIGFELFLPLQIYSIYLVYRYRERNNEGSRSNTSTFYLLLDLLSFFDSYHEGNVDEAFEVKGIFLIYYFCYLWGDKDMI